MTDQPNAGTVAPDDKPSGPVQHPLEYSGEAKALGWLVFKNTILTIITLGFYRFWAKTRVRKYIWNSQSLFGERLEYTGTGKELFLGFLIVLAVLIPLAILVNVGNFYIQTTGNTFAIVGFQIAYYILFIYLFGYAVFRARRYQLSRTQWRSIRFAQAGDAKQYGIKFLGYWLLAIVTLGLMAPLALIRLQTYLTNNMYFGQEKFRLEARAKDIFWQTICCAILAPFTLYLSVLWFAAFYARYTVSKTGFGSLQFKLPVTFGNYAKIYIPYVFVLAVILAGISSPVLFAWYNMESFSTLDAWSFSSIATLLLFLVLMPVIAIMMITHRFLGLFASKLEAHGTIDPDAFVQNAQEASKRGEGLADALDVGGGAGIEVGL